MRKLWLIGALVSALVLSACGAAATITSSVTSIGAAQDLQVHLSVSASGAGMAQAQGVLRALSLDMRYSSTNGANLADATGHINSEVAVNANGQALMDLRVVGTDLYVRIDLSGLAGIPGVNVTAAQLAAVQLLLGGRWFEVSESVLNSYLPTTTISPAQSSRELAAARAVLDALSKLIENTPYQTLSGGGFSQTGKLSAVANALFPIIRQYAPSTAVPHNVTGTYHLAFTMSGSTATGASVSITAPNGTKGNATLGVHAAITHDATAVVAPAGATVITRALITQLLGQVAGGALG